MFCQACKRAQEEQEPLESAALLPQNLASLHAEIARLQEAARSSQSQHVAGAVHLEELLEDEQHQTASLVGQVADMSTRLQTLQAGQTDHELVRSPQAVRVVMQVLCGLS